MKKRFIAVIVMIAVVASLIISAQGAVAANYPAPLETSFENTGDMRYDIVQRALSQVGYVEGTGSWNAFGNYFGNPTGSWCAYFVQWCAVQAGVPTSILPESRVGRVSDYWETASVELEFHPVNDYANPYTPQAGDLVIYRANRTYYDTVNGTILTYPTANTIACRFGRSQKNGVYTNISHIGIVARDAAYPTNNGSQINYAGFSMVDGNWHKSVVSRFELYENITGFVAIKYTEPEDQPTPTPAPEPNDPTIPGNPEIYVGQWPVLSKGSRGENVTLLQTMLNYYFGAGLAVDGEFGSATQRAVIRYQQQNLLKMDGIVGPATWKKLTRLVQTTANYDIRITRQIQSLLNNRFGIATSVDGIYGPRTANSVMTLQAITGIAKDGKVGPETWRILVCAAMQ